MGDTLLEFKNLVTEFRTEGTSVKAVKGVSFTLNKGETIGIVGESGSGKSVTSLSAMRLIPSPPGEITGGEIIFHQNDGTSTDLLKISEDQMRTFRGNDIAMIFQEPMTSLNPVFTCGNQVVEAIILHQKLNKKQAKELSRLNKADKKSIYGLNDDRVDVIDSAIEIYSKVISHLSISKVHATKWGVSDSIAVKLFHELYSEKIQIKMEENAPLNYVSNGTRVKQVSNYDGTVLDRYLLTDVSDTNKYRFINTSQKVIQIDTKCLKRLSRSPTLLSLGKCF